MTTTRTPLNHCPFCHEVVGAATSIARRASPAPGDYGVCWNCGNLLAYHDDLTVRESTVREMMSDPDVSPDSKRRMLVVQAEIRARGLLATRSKMSVFRPN